MEIVTTRLLLRDFTLDDAPTFVAYHADPRSTELHMVDRGAPPSASELLRTFIGWADEQPRRNYQLAIATRYEPGTVLGCCGLRQEGFGAGTAQLSIELAPDCWGHGYAYEAACAFLAFGFEQLGLSEVRGVSVSTNASVARLVRRLGFVAAATPPGPTEMQDQEWHHIDWRLMRETWQDR